MSPLSATVPLVNPSDLLEDAKHTFHRTLSHPRPLASTSGNKRLQDIPFLMSSPASLVVCGDRRELTPPHSPFNPPRKGMLPSPTIIEPDAAALDMLDLSAKPSDEETPRQNEAQQIPLETKHPTWEETVPRPYLERYELMGSVETGFEEYGRGAWSTVYRAVECLPPQNSAPLTPPTSPPNSPKQAGTNRLLAIKAPSRNDAHRILQQEARILTYLSSFPRAPDYLVPFRGYDQSFQSLVFSAVPLNLESHVKQAAKIARSNPSTKTMFNPVVGVDEWADLASHLISGLDFLHSENCVHGDIKPANILLRQSADSITPLFCDFSSSRIIVASTETGDLDDTEEVTAVTTDYTSPELLVSLHGRTPSARAIVTPASDVFALGVTLLFAAIGESPYASARMEVQKLAMAREGRPLDLARGGECASRVMMGQLVDKIIRMGVEKEVDKRVDVKEWMRRTESHIQEVKGTTNLG